MRHFRRPAVTVIGTSLTVHSETERAPVALQLHHMPVSSSFAVIDGIIVADPTDKESMVAGAQVTIACNIRKHVCLISKSGGTPIELFQLKNCIKMACDRAENLAVVIDNAVKEDHARRQARLEGSIETDKI